MEDRVDPVLNQMFSRLVTTWVSRDERVRVAHSAAPMFSEAFLVKGPISMILMSKGLLEMMDQPAACIDCAMVMDGVPAANVDPLPIEVRTSVNPSTAMDPLDYRLGIAREQVMEGDHSLDSLNLLLQTRGFKQKRWSVHGPLVRHHGRVNYEGCLSFQQWSKLPFMAPFPVGLGRHRGSAYYPRKIEPWSMNGPVFDAKDSALTELARPWRMDLRDSWLESGEAMYYHHESRSSLNHLLGQGFRMYDQLETKWNQDVPEVSVSLVPSYKTLFAAKSGAVASPVSWDWSSFWQILARFSASSTDGIIGEFGSIEQWLSMQAR